MRSDEWPVVGEWHTIRVEEDGPEDIVRWVEHLDSCAPEPDDPMVPRCLLDDQLFNGGWAEDTPTMSVGEHWRARAWVDRIPLPPHIGTCEYDAGIEFARLTDEGDGDE